MIVGVVSRSEALIALTIHGSGGRSLEADVVVDTGFSGWLTLTPRLIAMLGLRRRGFGQGVLADGSISLFDVYEAKVIWDGRMRRVRINEFEAAPLLGMSLLRGCELKMHVRSRGRVVITRLSDWGRQSRSPSGGSN
jgi:clan AA aspartic protease